MSDDRRHPLEFRWVPVRILACSNRFHRDPTWGGWIMPPGLVARDFANVTGELRTVGWLAPSETLVYQYSQRISNPDLRLIEAILQSTASALADLWRVYFAAARLERDRWDAQISKTADGYISVPSSQIHELLRALSKIMDNAAADVGLGGPE